MVETENMIRVIPEDHAHECMITEIIRPEGAGNFPYLYRVSKIVMSDTTPQVFVRIDPAYERDYNASELDPTE